MSGHETPDAGGDTPAGGPAPGDAEGSGGDAPVDDEVLEVLDVDDELAAMLREGPGDAGTGAGDAPAADPSAGDAAADAARQRDEYLDALRRLQADFENFKKRAARQLAEATARAGEALVDKLMPAFDTLDLAVAHGGGEELVQVRTALLDALGREGLERIAPEGEAFDPTRHDAVMHEAGEGGDGPEVVEVLRAGWSWKGRVLRPAMVKVRG